MEGNGNRTTENKVSRESDSKRGWRTNEAGGTVVVRGEKVAEEGRVKFTVRADQFLVLSIIDVTSTGGLLSVRLHRPKYNPHWEPTHKHLHLCKREKNVSFPYTRSCSITSQLPLMHMLAKATN